MTQSPGRRRCRLGARLVTLFAWTTTLLALALATVGCGTAIYQGAEPSARSFYEDPDFRQTYIGFDLNFCLEDPTPPPQPLQQPSFHDEPRAVHASADVR
jgi:hypothetical protein